MPMPNARNVMNEIESEVNYYRDCFILMTICSLILSGILCGGIYKICQNTTYKNLAIFLLACIAPICISMMIYKLYNIHKSKSKDAIFDIAIGYLKAVYVYKGYTQIEKISFFDIIDILSVYKRCIELNVLDKDQVNDLDIIIKDLKSQSDL